MHEIDSFKLPKENIDARLNMILLLELIVLMAGAVSNGFTKRMQYSLDFAQFAKFAGSKPCFIHTWLGTCFLIHKKRIYLSKVHKRDRSLTLLSKPVRGRQGNYHALIVRGCS